MNAAWEAAIRRGDAGAVRAILVEGTDLDCRDRYGQTALMLAAHAGHRDVVALLLEHGAALDAAAKYGLSALMLAVVAGHDDIARLLARRGADRALRGTGAPGFAGKTARDLALARGRPDLAADLVDAETVLAFWFADAAEDPDAARAREAFWFGAAPDVDAACRSDFAHAVEDAAAGVLDGWLAQPRTALALVLLLDQFPRNMHRGAANAFAHDARARTTAQRAVDAGYLDALRPIEASFVLLPFQHSEVLGDQHESVRLATSLLTASPPEWRSILERYLAFAREHLAIIERFGRFPHRNAALGRVSTAEERAYLAQGGATFGQG